MEKEILEMGVGKGFLHTSYIRILTKCSETENQIIAWLWIAVEHFVSVVSTDRICAAGHCQGHNIELKNHSFNLT